MKNIRTYFRAISDYRKNTDKVPECVRERNNISESCREEDLIECERVKCVIDTDWVEEIEKGLVFVEKALKEERQFIRSNGEVVPIEKAKNVSRTSVEHLSRHSELITRFDEDENLTPDKIYTVEKLSDYSVYENRFLYMMLCYLRDFVSLRYSLILEAVNTYKGSARVNKTVHSVKGELNFKMELSETSREDEYLSAHNEAKSVLDRIDSIYKTVTIFLSYPLMQEVKKSPMLKPPVTKTNVLKMNFNFKGALALYEYISAYNGDGYTLTKEVKTIKGFKGSVADDFSDIIKSASFAAYEYGLDIKEYLKGEYEKEELERKREAQQKLFEQIELLKKRIKESGFDTEEYILLLEKKNKILQEDSDRLRIEEKKNRDLTEKISAQEEEILSLNTALEEANENLLRQAEQHAQEIARLNATHREEIQKLNFEHEQTVQRLNREYELSMKKLAEEHETEITALKAAQKDEIDKLNSEHEQTVVSIKQEYDDKIDRLNAIRLKESEAARETQTRLETENGKLAEENSKKQSDIDELNRDKLLLKANVNALKHKFGAFDGNENFSEKENFDDVEEQYLEFKKFFKSTWSKTKKEIRKKSKEEATKSVADGKTARTNQKTDKKDGEES